MRVSAESWQGFDATASPDESNRVRLRIWRSSGASGCRRTLADLLDLDDVVPGFRCPVQEIFG
jgi:hypothetical protein